MRINKKELFLTIVAGLLLVFYTVLFTHNIDQAKALPIATSLRVVKQQPCDAKLGCKEGSYVIELETLLPTTLAGVSETEIHDKIIRCEVGVEPHKIVDDGDVATIVFNCNGQKITLTQLLFSQEK